MQKQRMTVELELSDVLALEALAAHDQRSLEDILTLAVRNYVSRRTMDDAEWKGRWEKAITTLRSGVPEDLTAEEIEAEASAARSEYREEQRARHD